MPITTDFEVFSSKYHNRTPYVSDPMDLPETARMIDNLNNEFDTLYDEKQELEEKCNDMTDKYLSMYKFKHNLRMLSIHMGMKENQDRLDIAEDDMWEYRVKDIVENLNSDIEEVIEDNVVDLVLQAHELLNKFMKFIK